MKVCVIGNSHVGALKLAWERMPPAARSLDLTFFAQRGGGIMQLRVDHNRLVPSSDESRDQLAFTSGGLQWIDPVAYDLLLVTGLYEHAPLTEDGSHYSQAVRRAALLDRITSQGSLKMVRRLRSITQQPIFVSLSPLPANLTGQPLPPPLLPYAEELDLLRREIFGPLDAYLVPQPQETIVEGRTTALKYSKGSRRLDVGLGSEAHGNRENAHMNEDYGRVWLTSFQRLLAERAGPHAEPARLDLTSHTPS